MIGACDNIAANRGSWSALPCLALPCLALPCLLLLCVVSCHSLCGLAFVSTMRLVAVGSSARPPHAPPSPVCPFPRGPCPPHHPLLAAGTTGVPPTSTPGAIPETTSPTPLMTIPTSCTSDVRPTFRYAESSGVAGRLCELSDASLCVISREMTWRYRRCSRHRTWRYMASATTTLPLLRSRPGTKA